MNLSPESVDAVIAEINEYKNRMVNMVHQLGESLVAEGVNIARLKITQFDAIETGELLSSVEGVFDASIGKGFIRVGTDHAAFVEFGTGIIGQTTQSLALDKPADWQYDVNQHGWEGWVYDHGRWTRGMPPRPFMYGTFLELCDIANEKMRMMHND